MHHPKAIEWVAALKLKENKMEDISSLWSETGQFFVLIYSISIQRIQRGVGDAPQRLCEDTFEDGAGRVLGWGTCKVVMKCSESSDRGINGVCEDLAGPEVGDVAEDDDDVGQDFAEP